MWNLDLVEEQETVVHGVVTKLGANITNVDVLQRLMCLQVSDLNTERCRAVGLSVNDELCHDNCVVGGTSKRSNPPFACCEMWRVDGEGLVFGIPGRGSLETTDVGTMTKLSLGVAADDLVILCLGEPQVLLLFCALLSKCDLMN